MRSRMTDFEWWALLGITAAMDVTQFLLDLFLAGLAVNRYIDIVYAMGAPFYLAMRGVEMNMKTLGIFAVSFVAEEVPLLDAAPFWTLDIWQIRKWDKAKKKAE